MKIVFVGARAMDMNLSATTIGSLGLLKVIREICSDDRLSKIQIKVLLAVLCSTERHLPNDLISEYRETLSKNCGYSERVISRTTTALVKLGWLEKTGRGGRGKPCQYSISMDFCNARGLQKAAQEELK